MAFSFSPKIVTDGLVLALDAANPKSYVSGSTVWRDLTPNENTGTLTNGPTYSSANGGSIQFDGVNSRVSRDLAVNSGDNFTVSAWIYPTLLGTTRRAVVGNGYNFSARNGWFFCTSGGNTNNTFFLSIGADAAYRVAAANTLNLNQWTNIVGTCSDGGSNIILYKNGVEITSYAFSLLTSGTISYSYNQINVGFRDYLGTKDPYTGNISLVQVYNRALSAQEVLQNYNALKPRFNLI